MKGEVNYGFFRYSPISGGKPLLEESRNLAKKLNKKVACHFTLFTKKRSKTVLKFHF